MAVSQKAESKGINNVTERKEDRKPLDRMMDLILELKNDTSVLDVEFNYVNIGGSKFKVTYSDGNRNYTVAKVVIDEDGEKEISTKTFHDVESDVPTDYFDSIKL